MAVQRFLLNYGEWHRVDPDGFESIEVTYNSGRSAVVCRECVGEPMRPIVNKIDKDTPISSSIQVGQRATFYKLPPNTSVWLYPIDGVASVTITRD